MRVKLIQLSLLRFCFFVTVLSSAFKQKRISITSSALRVDNSPSMKVAAEKFLVLGTGSFSRKAILTNAGYTFNVVKADIDEYAIGNRKDASLVSDLVLLLANAKADAILESNKIPLNMMDQILLTADQVVVYDNKILEKPQNKDEARMFIEGYGLLPCSTVGSIVLTDLTSKKRVQGVDICNIYFDPIPENIIQQLLDEGDVLNCAGGLQIEHPLIVPYRKKIEGTEESVMGLSIELLDSLLKKLRQS